MELEDLTYLTPYALRLTSLCYTQKREKNCLYNPAYSPHPVAQYTASIERASCPGNYRAQYFHPEPPGRTGFAGSGTAGRQGSR